MPSPPLLFLLGTRAEAIKAIPVLRALETRHPKIRARVGATGQHAMMFDQIVEIEGVQLAFNLEVMEPRQQIPELIGRALPKLDSAIHHIAPRGIVIVGDSASSVASALAAHATRIPFAHLEAGLRGTRPGLPFPEETFRKIISAAAAFHLAPTDEARQNLLREGVEDSKIEVVGDPGLDALAEKLAGDPSVDDPELRGIDWRRPIALVAVVRRENHADASFRICHALKRLADEEPDLQIIYPNHLNPHLMEPARQILARVERIRQTLPLPHQLFVNVLRRARLVIADSGGVQQEASALGIPIVSLRACPDRGRAMGVAPLLEAGNDSDRIVEAAHELLSRTAEANWAERTLKDFTPAAPRIADRLASPFA
ncbi:MAG: UDP-N-acetylglucosamine 2-epimerase (non-hydrolyzing) [Candidatus Sumerlaeota bacterium]|nr:UDP-N-acetylglucosamine 2-epimerase (non-hydrolyzing) [Candidatus Sumerlaeota bacterium]